MKDKERDGVNNGLLKKFLEPDRSHLPSYIRQELETSEIYTDFVINFLMRKRNGIGKIDSLVLKKNSIDRSVNIFLKKKIL